MKQQLSNRKNIVIIVNLLKIKNFYARIMFLKTIVFYYYKVIILKEKINLQLKKFK